MSSSESDDLSELQNACEKKKSFDFIKNLIKNGVDINKKDNNTALHNECFDKPRIEVIKLLINSGANPNIQNGLIPLHYVCRNKNTLEIVKFLIESGSEVDTLDDFTPLFNAFDKYEIAEYLLSKGAKTETSESVLYLMLINNAPLKNIELVLDYGADKTFILKEKKLEQLTKSKRIQTLIKCYDSLCEDMKLLLKEGGLYDINIKTQGKEIQAHSLILKLRLENQFEKFLENIQKEPFEIAETILEFIYTGYPFRNQIVIDFFNDLFGDSFFPKKVGKKNLIKDLTNLFNDSESKDFEIIIESNKSNSVIKVHKLILFARSELFKGMFLSVNDPSNSVVEQSKKSFQTMESLISFFYTDSIDISKLSKSSKKELFDSINYFGLNLNSFLQFFLKI
ncbi:ankyrin repeat-containing protein [Anaeramoeba ignava]|uniref:Ankyrin repeat-containing protein n=1 Tax=Anaeramoeba ignava TaxID=1746090 RepID=A0A9Q0L8F5_ANAIG|nr:ankyrin repeat-containing protein [Anaeramoeba ignava]